MTPFDPKACEDRFVAFYQAVHGHEPFPWQKRLAVRVCDPGRSWPRAIALPTAAGKTACIDVAVFALACRPGTPRRVFFVVDRRVVVDQARLHAEKLMEKLRTPETEIEQSIADALRDLAHPGWRELKSDEQKRVRPLDVYALRGGMYREDTWVRSPLQPTVVTSTVDQVGSRLLFRGYGVSDSMKPVHAGLVGNDALILLDEAHCSTAFAETAAAVEQYRKWNDSLAPFAFVQMTATPAGDVPPSEIERDEDDDRAHPFLGKRINAAKPTTLVTTKAKGKNWQKPLVEKLAEAARGLMGQKAGEPDEVRAVGVIVNRVATARELRRTLESADADVILLTGRMRPLDRDRILGRLRPLFTASPLPLERPTYVVATQCLEVGADLDFHALVTECASLDALRQRFGRLNRHAQARTFAPGVVVVRADQTEPAEKEADRDPVYGNALANTWKWLRGEPTRDEIDFGVAAIRERTADLSPEQLAELNVPADHAPVLLPAYLDCWVQTAPVPAPDPDPALFLHGPKRPGVPDVQVVFRADLGTDSEAWAEIVSLCPPSSSEALPVRIDVFRRWLAHEDALPDDLADAEGTGREDEDTPPPARAALRWAGPDDSELVSDSDDVRPNATYVVTSTADRLDVLGDFPVGATVGGAPEDHADEAFQHSRDRAVLRLPDLALDLEDDGFRQGLSDAIVARAAADSPDWLHRAVQHLSDPRNRTVAAYPKPLTGFVVTGKRRLHRFDPTFADDESSESPTGRPVSLDAHTRGVMDFADRFATGCGLDGDLRDRFALAARWHDLGKADPRFQAMLYASSPQTVARRPLLAKSGAAPGSKRERDEARTVHRYPKGGRHELLSVAFAAERTDDDLVLHLIAAHHGECRPFAPPYADDTTMAYARPSVRLLDEDYPRPQSPSDPATANATAPDRFWRVVRRYGWWGSAYLDALFRLADHAASRAEQQDGWVVEEKSVPRSPAVPLPAAPAPVREVPLTGLDGSNPLAFLAAMGTLRLADQLYPEVARMRWEQRGRWVPVLTVPAGATDETLIDELHGLVHGSVDPSAEKTADARHKVYRAKLKEAEKAKKQVAERKLRGEERMAALAAEVEPLRREADLARAEWLAALLNAVPAAFLSLGKALSVSAEEFRNFTHRVTGRLQDGTADGRQDADFTAAFGCDGCSDPVTGRITPTELQLITGSGHQFFLETLGNLMTCVSPEQLHRGLFGPWLYADPRLSFRWDPTEDRRYAYGWEDPSGEEVRTEHGANLLAAFGLPLFPVIPTPAGAVTTGFAPGTDPPAFTWPLWRLPLSADAIRSQLSLAWLRSTPLDRVVARRFGVVDANRVRKIEVGRPPLSKLNLTAAVTV